MLFTSVYYCISILPNDFHTIAAKTKEVAASGAESLHLITPNNNFNEEKAPTTTATANSTNPTSGATKFPQTKSIAVTKDSPTTPPIQATSEGLEFDPDLFQKIFLPILAIVFICLLFFISYLAKKRLIKKQVILERQLKLVKSVSIVS